MYNVYDGFLLKFNILDFLPMPTAKSIGQTVQCVGNHKLVKNWPSKIFLEDNLKW
jgi:hypothetical protein